MTIRRVIKETKEIDVVCVDFFDTVMFRKIHSHQLMPQWEKELKRVLPNTVDIDLCAVRREIIESFGKSECEINYRKLTKAIYSKISSIIGDLIDEESFNELSYLVDYSIDIVTQYPNNRMIRTLKKMKDQGRKIVLVSDYYLPGECYIGYLRPFGLESLFDKIYCSSDYQQTKENGGLYDIVISDLMCDKKKVVMIGDSIKSDYKMAKEHGIKAVKYMPFAHKVLTNYRKKTCYDFSKHIFDEVFKTTFRYTPFGDYSLNLYYFVKQLSHEVRKNNNERICFLSRGGYFLKKCFDRTEQLSTHQCVKTDYIRNSRKVNQLAEKNEDDKKLLGKYISEYTVNGKICVVDEGWYCTSQIIMSRLFSFDVDGYYIGIMGRNSGDEHVHRKGLLFDIDENGIKTPLYGVFRTNCTLYEQLLSAPHGSLKRYFKDDAGNIDFQEEWTEIEKKNYEENIDKIQKIILDYVSGIVTWNAELSKYKLACYVLKSLMFGNNKRLVLQQKILDSWYDNANDTSKKRYANARNIKVSIGELIFQPEEYLRYFCKLKELKLTKGWMRVIYPIIGTSIYLYCRLSIMLKYRKE